VLVLLDREGLETPLPDVPRRVMMPVIPPHVRRLNPLHPRADVTVAFGSDRNRFTTADEVQAYSGIAPVTKRSGKSCRVSKRYFCNRFLRQTFHEFADHARKWSTWSKAFYEHLRARGHRHHAALRALAFKWIRILFACWKNRQPYDENRYLHQLCSKGVPYLPKSPAA
jgi:transposase